MRRLFLVNPRAGGGRALQWWRSIRPRFSAEIESGESCEWIPESPAELALRLKERLQGAPGEWVIIGGDGTLHSVVNGFSALRESGDRLGDALPLIRVAAAGSGSDYFRSLPEKEAIPVDLVRLTLEGSDSRYFLNMASVGVGAKVAAAKERLPAWMPRALCYALPTVTEIWGARPFRLEMRLAGGGEPVGGRAWAVFFSKGRYAGGGMRFASEVRLNDGELEISWIEDRSAFSVFGQIPRLYGEGLRAGGGVRKFRAAELELAFAEPQPFECDGETGTARRLAFRVIPAASSGLRVGRFSPDQP